MSVATTRASGARAASAIARQPLPVQRSRADCGAGADCKKVQARSASNSVSGRGIRTFLLTVSSNPQNETVPTMYCSGSRAPRRWTRARSVSTSAGRELPLEIEVELHARHLQDMLEQQLDLEARRRDASLGEILGAALDHFQNGHGGKLTQERGALKRKGIAPGGFLAR